MHRLIQSWLLNQPICCGRIGPWPVQRDLTPILTAAAQESPSINAHGAAPERQDHAVEGGVSAAQLREPGGPGHPGLRVGGPPRLPVPVPGRRDHRRGAAGPGAPLLPAGNHRRGPTAGPMGPDGFAESLPVRVGEPVPSPGGQRSIIFFPWPGARSCGSPSTRRRWRRPFSPAAIPAYVDEGLNPSEWLRSYVATYIERDVRAISQVGDLTTFQRFVELCAGRTAQLVNYSSLASDCGVSQPTARAWLGILEASFIVFRLPPFHANLGKRLVKMPKLHFYDTGLVCWLIGIRTPEQLRSHPLRGPIFETWVVSEIVKHRMNLGARRGLFFYRNRGRGRGRPGDRAPFRGHAGRSQVVPDALFEPLRRGEPRSRPSGRFFPPMRHSGSLRRRRVPGQIGRTAGALGQAA